MEDVFLISHISKLLKIHPQTIRQYERYGLINPDRTKSNIRVYKQKDIQTLKTIINLTRDLGVNLAGVDIILRLKNDIIKLENEITQLKSDFLETNCVVPKNKSLVKKKYSHTIIISNQTKK